MNLQQLILILKARYKIALFTMFIIVAATLAISLLISPRYAATTSIVVDVHSPDPLLGTILAGPSTSYLPTQVDIITSDRTAHRAIRILQLDKNRAVRDKWLEETEGRGKLENWLAAVLLNNLKVKPSTDSNVINIKYTSADPQFSAAVANAFARAYMETTVALKAEPAQEYATWFNEQGKTLRENLEKAQAKLAAFQQQQGIVVTDARVDTEMAKLSDLSAQLTAVEALSTDARSKASVGNGADTLPEVMNSSLIQNLKADVSRLEGKIREAGSNLGANHPQYRQMQAELSALKQSLRAETQKIASSYGTSVDVGSDRAGLLRQLIAAQKQKIFELQTQRDQARVLEGEVAAAQKAYDSVADQYTKTSLEGKATQTNVSVLSAAEPPLSPTAPLPALYTMIAAVLGTFIGIGVAFLMEMFDRRIRTIEDVEIGMGLPVLAVINRQPSGLRRLWGRVNVLPKPNRPALEFMG
ncbi:MAG TPA: chain length determinant protein EpsF [Methylophilaceae bacterium]|nr:chain length determinant protein EpsF [Methylophilaceae bacterium]